MSTYDCEKCGKSFAQRSLLTRHMKRKTPCFTGPSIDERVNKAVAKELSKIVAPDSLRKALVAPRPAKAKIPMIDLFAGTGAFSLAFHDTDKVETVFANDLCPKSSVTYNENFTTKLTLKDINDLDIDTIPHHDILTGGFPCQPFSIAGRQQGFDDERSNVFWRILRIIEMHQPKIVLLENVKNLCSHDNGETFRVIVEAIEKRGYHIKHKVLNTCVVTDIPQNRERIYIACFKEKASYDKFNFDFGPAPETRPISDFLEVDVPDQYYYSDRYAVWDAVRDGVENEGSIYQYRRYYVRENKGGVCPTLTANMGGGGHNVPLLKDSKGIRKLTPRECFNLQGFPPEYKLPSKLSDSALYKLAGNAVSVPVVQLIADKMMSLGII